MLAYSLTTFCTKTAWMCPGREVTLELSMISKVACGLGRCLQQERGEEGRGGERRGDWEEGGEKQREEVGEEMAK